MTDDTITLDIRIETGTDCPPDAFEKFNTMALQDFRRAWKAAGCTSRVRRHPESFTVEVTGPAGAVLDAMAEMQEAARAWEIIRLAARVSAAIDADVRSAEDRDEHVFVCPNGHVTSAPRGGLVDRYLAKIGPPRCPDCSERTRFADDARHVPLPG